MEENIIKYGGRVGAIVACVMVFAFLCFFACIANIEHPSQIVRAVNVAIVPMTIPTLVIAGIGYLLGKMAARVKRLSWAIISDGIYAGLMFLGISCPALVVYVRSLNLPTRNNLIPPYLLTLTIMVACGAIHGELTTIYVRDYHENRRTRLVPQFTLQELFIFLGLLSVIVSALATFPTLPGLYET
jgi:hypothetical protein